MQTLYRDRQTVQELLVVAPARPTQGDQRATLERHYKSGNPTMRAIIVIVVLILILGLVGWIQFRSIDGDPTIRVDTDKVKQDTSAIVEKSKQAVGSAAEKIDASINREPLEPTNNEER